MTESSVVSARVARSDCSHADRTRANAATRRSSYDMDSARTTAAVSGTSERSPPHRARDVPAPGLLPERAMARHLIEGFRPVAEVVPWHRSPHLRIDLASRELHPMSRHIAAALALSVIAPTVAAQPNESHL